MIRENICNFLLILVIIVLSAGSALSRNIPKIMPKNIVLQIMTEGTILDFRVATGAYKVSVVLIAHRKHGLIRCVITPQETYFCREVQYEDEIFLKLSK